MHGESDESDLPLEEEIFYKSNEIEVILDTEATALRPHQHLLTLSYGSDFAYHTCILATGAIPTPLPAPVAQDPGVHYLRSRRDARTLRQAAASSRWSVVIGSGFIGCEAAASLAPSAVST